MNRGSHSIFLLLILLSSNGAIAHSSAAASIVDAWTSIEQPLQGQKSILKIWAHKKLTLQGIEYSESNINKLPLDIGLNLRCRKLKKNTAKAYAQFKNSCLSIQGPNNSIGTIFYRDGEGIKRIVFTKITTEQFKRELTNLAQHLSTRGYRQ